MQQPGSGGLIAFHDLACSHYDPDGCPAGWCRVILVNATDSYLDAWLARHASPEAFRVESPTAYWFACERTAALFVLETVRRPRVIAAASG